MSAASMHVPSLPPPTRTPADVALAPPTGPAVVEPLDDAANAALELKVTKLKRALTACVERANQLTDENAKLRRQLDQAQRGDGAKRELACYTARVPVLLSFLREEDKALFELFERALLTQLTYDEDCFKSKAALNAEMQLIRERHPQSQSRQLHSRGGTVGSGDDDADLSTGDGPDAAALAAAARRNAMVQEAGAGSRNGKRGKSSPAEGGASWIEVADELAADEGGGRQTLVPRRMLEQRIAMLEEELNKQRLVIEAKAKAEASAVEELARAKGDLSKIILANLRRTVSQAANRITPTTAAADLSGSLAAMPSMSLLPSPSLVSPQAAAVGTGGMVAAVPAFLAHAKASSIRGAAAATAIGATHTTTTTVQSGGGGPMMTPHPPNAVAMGTAATTWHLRPEITATPTTGPGHFSLAAGGNNRPPPEPLVGSMMPMTVITAQRPAPSPLALIEPDRTSGGAGSSLAVWLAAPPSRQGGAIAAVKATGAGVSSSVPMISPLGPRDAMGGGELPQTGRVVGFRDGKAPPPPAPTAPSSFWPPRTHPAVERALTDLRATESRGDGGLASTSCALPLLPRAKGSSTIVGGVLPEGGSREDYSLTSRGHSSRASSRGHDTHRAGRASIASERRDDELPRRADSSRSRSVLAVASANAAPVGTQPSVASVHGFRQLVGLFVEDLATMLHVAREQIAVLTATHVACHAAVMDQAAVEVAAATRRYTDVLVIVEQLRSRERMLCSSSPSTKPQRSAATGGTSLVVRGSRSRKTANVVVATGGDAPKPPPPLLSSVPVTPRPTSEPTATIVAPTLAALFERFDDLVALSEATGTEPLDRFPRRFDTSTLIQRELFHLVQQELQQPPQPRRSAADVAAAITSAATAPPPTPASDFHEELLLLRGAWEALVGMLGQQVSTMQSMTLASLRRIAKYFPSEIRRLDADTTVRDALGRSALSLLKSGAYVKQDGLSQWMAALRSHPKPTGSTTSGPTATAGA